jgi:hypothetical protein
MHHCFTPYVKLYYQGSALELLEYILIYAEYYLVPKSQDHLDIGRRIQGTTQTNMRK